MTARLEKHRATHLADIALRLRSSQEALVGLLVLLIVVLAAVALDGFARIDNLIDIIRSSTTLGVLSIAGMFVVIARGLDLSVVAVMGVSSSVALQMTTDGTNQWLALLVGFLLAMLLGLVNGLLVAYVDIPPLFATIATALLFMGTFRFLYFEHDVSQLPRSATFVRMLGTAEVAGISVSALIFAAVAVIAAWLMRRNIGRYLVAIGDNPDAARLTGLPVRPLVAFTYVLAGVLAFVAGVNLAATSGTYDLKTAAAGGQLYDVIAVIVIGGVSLSGGRGTVIGVVLAALLLSVVSNAMTLLDFNTIQQALAKALIVLIAIVLDSILHPRDEENTRVGDL